MQQARGYLKGGIDTTGIHGDLANIENWHAVAGDGVFVNKGTAQTYRNLTTSYNLLLVLQKISVERKDALDEYQHRLSMFRFHIDSLASDPAMFTFPDDSAALVKYLDKMQVTLIEIAPVDSMLKTAISNVQTLQRQVNVQVFKTANSIDEIELLQRQIYRHTFNRQFANLWGPVGDNRPFSAIATYSKAKGLLTLRFYAQNNAWKIGLLLLLIGLSAIYLHSLKKIYQQKEWVQADQPGSLVLRYPLLSAIMIVISVFQFIFTAPPFIFTAILWTIAAASLTFIYFGFISRYWMMVWLTLSLLFVIACLDNLVLQASRVERWGMLLLGIAGIIAAGIVLWKRKYWGILKEQWIIYFIGFMGILELGAVITNCFGLYNFSKTLLTSGYFNVIIAIMFLWTVRLINEALELAFTVYQGQNRKLFYINFQRVGTKVPALFYLFLIVGWLILFGRNFYTFSLVSTPVRNFLSQERNVGDYTFTINTLVLFVFILGLSVVISRVVSYFASDRHLGGNATSTKEMRTGLGSWLLLIRISIITLGLFFAFAAAGIPMDKVAIILGALGVGIGFGLQTLVNNLVSGLIIAFEKPVNVGDVVEVDNQAGTMKSIGFRSSVISTWDGADMVMPNGDLLNSHLINWTLAGGRRRMNLVLGVAYGTDLPVAQQLLMEIIGKDDRILQSPAPLVIFQDFNNSAIDVKLLFWVRTTGDALPAKSDLIMAINKAFQEHNISIPFPQQDIHIHTKPPSPDTEKGPA
ncbi:mechanosensitive ion channel family protein, partial [Chitinophaga sp.]|uniref:mechanosensitive ion channel family protein n=1 Tax=Chitinophaga sp. TaxID=1869181 RepID=UPI002F945B62